MFRFILSLWHWVRGLFARKKPMAVLFTGPRVQVVLASGAEAGAQIFTYAAGTLTPLATYTDQSGTTPNANPVICDANGQADVWMTANIAYRVRVYRSVANGGALVSDTDNLNSTATAIGAQVLKVKALVTQRVSTTTLTDDPELIGALGVGSWSVKIFLIPYGVTTGTQGFKYTLNFTGAFSVGSFAPTKYAVGAFTASPTNAPTFVLSTATIDIVLTGGGWQMLEGTILVTTGGNLSVQWAQNSSSANATVLNGGSYMICTKLS